MKNIPKTWQELKYEIESLPTSTNGVEITCICGRCKPPRLTDENYKELFEILNGESQTQK